MQLHAFVQIANFSATCPNSKNIDKEYKRESFSFHFTWDSEPQLHWLLYSSYKNSYISSFSLQCNLFPLSLLIFSTFSEPFQTRTSKMFPRTKWQTQGQFTTIFSSKCRQALLLKPLNKVGKLHITLLSFPGTLIKVFPYLRRAERGEVVCKLGRDERLQRLVHWSLFEPDLKCKTGSGNLGLSPTLLHFTNTRKTKASHHSVSS